MGMTSMLMIFIFHVAHSSTDARLRYWVCMCCGWPNKYARTGESGFCESRTCRNTFANNKFSKFLILRVQDPIPYKEEQFQQPNLPKASECADEFSQWRRDNPRFLKHHLNLPFQERSRPWV